MSTESTTSRVAVSEICKVWVATLFASGKKKAYQRTRLAFMLALNSRFGVIDAELAVAKILSDGKALEPMPGPGHPDFNTVRMFDQDHTSEYKAAVNLVNARKLVESQKLLSMLELLQASELPESDPLFELCKNLYRSSSQEQ